MSGTHLVTFLLALIMMTMSLPHCVAVVTCAPNGVCDGDGQLPGEQTCCSVKAGDEWQWCQYMPALRPLQIWCRQAPKGRDFCKSCTYRNCCHCTFVQPGKHCPIPGWRSPDYYGGQ